MSDPTIIRITRHYSDEFTAITDDYDGPGSKQGCGDTWLAAVEDLLEQYWEEDEK